MSFTQGRIDAALGAAVANTTHIQLHDGDPGGAGTANVAAEVAGRVAFVFPAVSSGETEQSALFEITGAGGPYSHATGWNQSSGGTHQWTSELDPAEEFAGAGELTVTITASAQNAA